MINIEDFEFATESFEGEFKIVMSYIINCSKLMIASNEPIVNNEDWIKNKLVKDYVDNNNIKATHGITTFLFTTEVASIGESYFDKGYYDIYVCLYPHTFTDSKNVFIIECKRLDGEDKLNQKYVANGIMRYVENKYPTDLGINGMIGFCIKKFDCDKNIGKLNRIISTKHPKAGPGSKLDKTYEFKDFDNAYISEHKTILSNSSFNLYHAMVDYSSLQILPNTSTKSTKIVRD